MYKISQLQIILPVGQTHLYSDPTCAYHEDVPKGGKIAKSPSIERPINKNILSDGAVEWLEYLKEDVEFFPITPRVGEDETYCGDMVYYSGG